MFDFEPQSSCFAHFLASEYALLLKTSIKNPGEFERIGLLGGRFGMNKALLEIADGIEFPEIDTEDPSNLLDDCPTVTLI